MIAAFPAPRVLRHATPRRWWHAVFSPGGSSLLGLALLLMLPAPLCAQGLGAAASRERARRHAEPVEQGEAPAKVFTNDDLSSEEPGRGEDASAADAADGTPAVTDANPDADAGTATPGRESDAEFRERVDKERADRALKEREWRARLAEARARVREEEAKGWRDVVRTEFRQGIPVQMKVKEFVETEEYRQAKRDLADLQEEFRRTGLPPGWARE